MQPLAYALKAFDLCSAGTIIPVTVSPTNQDLSVYGVLGRDKFLYLTLINKEVHERAEVRVETPLGYRKAESMALSAQGSDPAATAGVTLGGTSIDADGKWRGEWRTLESNGKPGELAVALEPASAIVIRLRSSQKTR